MMDVRFSGQYNFISKRAQVVFKDLNERCNFRENVCKDSRELPQTDFIDRSMLYTQPDGWVCLETPNIQLNSEGPWKNTCEEARRDMPMLRLIAKHLGGDTLSLLELANKAHFQGPDDSPWPAEKVLSKAERTIQYTV